MQPRLTLRTRVLLAFLGVTAVTILGFYYSVARFVEVLEEELLDRPLADAMDDMVGDYRHDRSKPLRVYPDFRLFVGAPDRLDAVPAALRRFEPGLHDDIRFEDTDYDLRVQDAEGARFFLLHDVSGVEELEGRLIGIAWACGLTALLIATLTALWLSARFTRPVTQLAGRVATLDPAQSSQRVLIPGSDPDDEVAVIAQAFDRYLDRLEAFIARERAFTEDASHELRTPITIVQTSVQLLLDDASLPDAARERVKRVDRAAAQMGMLIEALLFLAREGGSQASDACALDDVVRNASAHFAEVASGKSVVLEAQIEPCAPLMAPPGMVACVVNNLLVNAVHYTHQGRIDVRLADGRLTVQDTGEGIAPEDLSRVFERRFRGSGSRGLGLGLYLVKRICTHLGWTIEVTSRQGEGTRFDLEFGR